MFHDLLELFHNFSQIFHQAGKGVFLVGGALRNRLLDRPVGDFDFATDALPEEVQKLFPRVIPTGIKHGTVTVLFRGLSLEVTTFRLDGKYSDQRHPDAVHYSRSLHEDLLRRDFTMNALALDMNSGELIDIVNGKQDIQDRVIRAIGDPFQRFQEDALRILRLFRFASQLGFSIDEKTRRAASAEKERLKTLSRERIRDEVLKTTYAEQASRGWKAWQDDALIHFFFKNWKGRDLPYETLKLMDQMPQEWRLIFARIASEESKNDLSEWDQDLRELAFSNEQRNLNVSALALIQNLPSGEPEKKSAKRLLQLWGSKELRKLDSIILALADLNKINWDKTKVPTWLQLFEEIHKKNEPVFIKDLQVKGNDLISLGIRQGPEMGRILQELLSEVWQNPELNNKTELIEHAKKLGLAFKD
jgi:tRNA nucleotidyltransferase/poly(A) polymerase